jgi:hypothetical protein
MRVHTARTAMLTVNEVPANFARWAVKRNGKRFFPLTHL